MILKHSAYNLIGNVLTSIVSLVCIRAFFNLLGAEKFGIVSLLWIIVGYFGLFDLGLSRAVALRVAQKTHTGVSAGNVIFTGILFSGAITGFTLIAMVGIAPWVLGWSATLAEASRGHGFRWALSLGVIIASVTMSAVAAGVLEGRQKFFTVNVVGVISNVLWQVCPIIAVLKWGAELNVVINAAVTARLLSAIVLMLVATSYFNDIVVEIPCRKEVMFFLRFGSSLTITNIVSPIITSVDQLLIGSVLGAGRLSYYSIPSSLAARTSIVAGALARAMFPRLSMGDLVAGTALAQRSVAPIAIVMTAIVVIGIIFSRIILAIWIGADFATEAAPILQILLVGMWANSFAHVPAALMQAQGRPWLVARIQLFELVPYLSALYVAIKWYGLEGAAMVWSCRFVVDSALHIKVANLKIEWLSVFVPAAMLIFTSIWVSVYAVNALSVILIVLALSVCVLLWAVVVSPEMFEVSYQVIRSVSSIRKRG